jgi:hypothetical protein
VIDGDHLQGKRSGVRGRKREGMRIMKRGGDENDDDDDMG